MVRILNGRIYCLFPSLPQLHQAFLLHLSQPSSTRMAVRSPVSFRIPPCCHIFLRFGAHWSHTLRLLNPSKPFLSSRLLIAARAAVFPGGSSLDSNVDPPRSASPAAASSIIDFLTLCHRLKVGFNDLSVRTSANLSLNS